MVDEPLIVVEGARISYAGPSAGAGVLLSDGETVTALGGGPAPPEADEELHVDGFIMPGVVDRHVHIALSDPGAVVARGATAVRDLGWPPEVVLPLAEASESPSFAGPLIRAVGPILTCRGGYPTRSAWAPPGTGREVHGPEEAAAAASEALAASGVHVVKVALNADAGPTLSDAELVAICETAHAREAIVTCHAQGRGQVERALGAGVDELAHCPWSERLGDDVIAAMAARMRIVSTLDIHSYGRHTAGLGIALDNLRRFVASGGAVVYGTDLGNGPIPPGIHVGEALHLQAAGLSPERVLEAMTFRPLAPNEPADLVALGGDPLKDLGTLDDIRLVIRGGSRMA